MTAIASEMTSDDIMCVPEVCARCHSCESHACVDKMDYCGMQGVTTLYGVPP